MNDPFDLLRDQLVTAARPRRRHGGLVLVVLAALLSVTAVAAAVTMSGNAPPAVAPSPDAGTPPTVVPSPSAVPLPEPEFELRPDLTAGNIGWCGSLPGSNACGPAGSPQRAMIVAGGGWDYRRGGAFYAVVGERVATVVLGGRRLVPRPDPRVPAPWKLVLASTSPAQDLRFLDARGAELPFSDARGSWAMSRHRYPTRRSDPNGPCRMRIPAPFRVRSTSVISSIPAGRDDVVSPSFLACATTVVYLGKIRLRAAILLNAHAPSNTAPLLPGMAAEPAGIAVTGRLTSARRAGDGWLMVYGAEATQRERLLRAITEQAP